MSKIGFMRNNKGESARKQESIARKRQKRDGLKDLLATWEARELAGDHSARTHAIILQLRAKHRNAKNQLLAMGEWE